MTFSLRRRLLVLATLILAGFLGATGLVLDHAFQESLERARRDRLQGYLYTLLASASLEDGRLDIPADLPESRFHTVGSGLYARVLDDAGRVNWQSPSLTGLTLELNSVLAPGQRRHDQVEIDGESVHVLGYGLSWEDADGAIGEFTAQVAESTAATAAQLATYRTSLWGWLLAAATALLVAQLVMLRWSLQPLRQVTDDLAAIENGRRERLDGRYPREIMPLTEGLNQLIGNERERATRYRNNLADLAHSLKTPLTVLRTTLEADPARPPPPEALEQIDRIRGAVDYQLGRAATVGQSRFGQSTPVRSVAERLMRTVTAIRPDGPPETTLDCPSGLRFPGPEGDLMELLGNLLDNASKWCNGRIALRVETVEDEGRTGIRMTVDDDGPGVPDDQRERILRRGGRADETRPGQGIGLAVVRELVDGYGGSITVEDAPAGGARFRLFIPGPAGRHTRNVAPE